MCVNQPIRHQIFASSISPGLVEIVYMVESVSETISLNVTPVGENRREDVHNILEKLTKLNLHKLLTYAL